MTRQRSHLLRPTLALLAGAGLLVGCSDAKEKATEQVMEEIIEQNGGGNVDVELGDDGEIVGIETDDGTMTIGGGSLPDAWPTDVPSYEGGRIISSQSFDTNGEVLLMVSYEVDDAPAAAADSMKAALEAAGFTIDSSGSTEDGSGGGFWSVTGTRGNQTLSVAVVGSATDPTMMQLSLSIKPEA
ncbi:MAG TPA: hypothetical protein DCR14_14965 [Acidimicrobiaceae bacterium]|nr:hypothetical protein [Acidimicrobiaceae bacterium]